MWTELNQFSFVKNLCSATGTHSDLPHDQQTRVLCQHKRFSRFSSEWTGVISLLALIIEWGVLRPVDTVSCTALHSHTLISSASAHSPPNLFLWESTCTLIASVGNWSSLHEHMKTSHSSWYIQDCFTTIQTVSAENVTIYQRKSPITRKFGLSSYSCWPQELINSSSG